jgi:hypothetical protein
MSGEKKLALGRMKGGRADLVMDKNWGGSKKANSQTIRQSYVILSL